MDMLLVDHRQVRERLSLDYPFPDPDTLFDEIGMRLRQLRKTLKPALRGRVQGIGVAAPLSLGGWNALLGVAPELAAKWHGIDLRERIAALGATAGLPVQTVKDTAAACVAELVAGRGRSIPTFLYVFVDTFIGGGWCSTATRAAARAAMPRGGLVAVGCPVAPPALPSNFSTSPAVEPEAHTPVMST